MMEEMREMKTNARGGIKSNRKQKKHGEKVLEDGGEMKEKEQNVITNKDFSKRKINIWRKTKKQTKTKKREEL